jgi:hypothetical protein
MKPGDLVQIRKGVTGEGDVGVVIGERLGHSSGGYTYTQTLNQVLFTDGVRDVHPSNLQKPDGRTRRRP